MVKDETVQHNDQPYYEMYRIIAENTTDTIVLVDNRGVTVYASPSLKLLIGYEVDEYIGMDAFDIIPIEDREEVRTCYGYVLQNKVSVEIQYGLIHKAGHSVYVETRVKPVLADDGSVKYVVAVVRDISIQKRAEIAIEESQQRYKSLFENNLDGVFTIELERFYVINANRAFEDITGIAADEMKQRCFLGMIYDEDHIAVYETLFQIIAQGKPQNIECRLTYKELEERIVDITFVPIFLAGQLNGIHCIIKDITKKKRDQLELIKKEERSTFLQMSLNRLANDLAKVTKVAELEERLIAELKAVLQVKHASIVEEDGHKSLGQSQSNHRYVKFGVKQRPVYLVMESNHPLDSIEEEWLETALHYATMLYDNLHRIEDLMKRVEHMVASNETPRWMVKLLFKLSEKERASLSSDLHDSVLQDLIIWYRKLESLRSLNTFDPAIGAELMQIEEGVLDAIHQIRITCNELRPPFLLKMGLVESLKSLFAYTRMFANYEIEFNGDSVQASLSEDQILGVYRIVQELLNNASKHSNASKVDITLTEDIQNIHFYYNDDGVGIDVSAIQGSFQHMGIAGIEKRVLSLEGEIQFASAPRQGLHVNIIFPKHTNER